MFKKAIFVSLMCALGLQAQMVNGIAAIVENEPITLFEVYRTKEQMQTDDMQALSVLIRDRLEQAEIKNLGISASPFEVNERIDAIARQNNMTTSQFRSSVEARGVRFIDFRSDIEKSILQEKLYRNITADVGKNINEQRARAYFEANPQQFVSFASADVVLFRASTMQALEAQNGDIRPKEGVTATNLTLSSSQIPPQLAAIIASTSEGAFTQILRGQEGFDMFYVKNKSGQYQPSFEQVREQILNSLYQNEQENLIHDYFEKLRAKAKIKIIR